MQNKVSFISTKKAANVLVICVLVLRNWSLNKVLPPLRHKTEEKIHCNFSFVF